MNERMKRDCKKIYEKPVTKVVSVEVESLFLAGSIGSGGAGTGVTGNKITDGTGDGPEPEPEPGFTNYSKRFYTTKDINLWE